MRAAGDVDRLVFGQGGLHLQGARDGSGASVAIEPAGDAIAADADDASMKGVDLIEETRIDRVELAGEFLGAALRAELGGESGGKFGEAENIRK